MSDKHESSSDECFPPVGHRHDRFPTAEELNAFLGDEVSASIDAELAVMAYERHLMRIARHDITALRSHRDIFTIPRGITDDLSTLGLGPIEMVAECRWVQYGRYYPLLARGATTTKL